MKKRFCVAIIGEGETEWFYFESLRVAKRYPFKIAPTLAQNADIGHMVKLVDYFVKEEFNRVFCLLDMDRLLRVTKEMQVYQNAKRKYSKCRNTKVMFIDVGKIQYICGESECFTPRTGLWPTCALGSLAISQLQKKMNPLQRQKRAKVRGNLFVTN